MPDQNEGARLSHTIVRSVIPGRGNAVAALAVRVDAATRPGMRHQTLPPALWGQASATLGKVREWLRSDEAAEIAHESDERAVFPGTRIDHAPLWVARALGLPDFQRQAMIRMTGGDTHLSNRPTLEYVPEEGSEEAVGPRRHGVFLDHGTGLVTKVPSALAAFHTRLEAVAARPDSQARSDGFERALRDLLPRRAYDVLRATGQVTIRIAGNMRLEKEVLRDGRMTHTAYLTAARDLNKPLLSQQNAEAFLKVFDTPLASDIPGVVRLVGGQVLLMSEPLRIRVSALRDFRALTPDEREALALAERDLPPGEAAAWETSAFGEHVIGYSFYERPRMSLLIRRPTYGGHEVAYLHDADDVNGVTQGPGTSGAAYAGDIAGAAERVLLADDATRQAIALQADEADESLSRLGGATADEADPEGGGLRKAGIEAEGDDIQPTEAGAIVAPDVAAAIAAARLSPRIRRLMVKSNVWKLERVLGTRPRPVDAGIPVDAVMAKLKPSSALKPHQAAAFRRFAAAYAAGAPGRILADDPGLGKTLTSLCLAAWLAMQRAGPVLVVVPNDVAKVWKDQAIEHFSGNMLPKPVVAHGALFTRATGGDLYDQLARIRRSAWTVTTYDTLRRCGTLLATIKFAAVVFDEGQILKNPLTELRLAVTGLNWDFGVVVSGTPIENGLSELWSVVDLVSPGRLGTLSDFMARQRVAGDTEEELAARIDAMARELSQELTIREEEENGIECGLLLRRLKRDVLDLPDKHLRPHHAPLTPEQVAAYDRIERQHRRMGPGGAPSLQRLTLERKASLHPDRLTKKGQVMPDVMTDEFAEAFIARSAAFSHARGVLERTIAQGERSLVSVHFVERQVHAAKTLGQVLDMGDLPYINGRMPVGEREAVVQAWRDSKRPVPLLITPGTGGLGLTLVEANHVIHLSRWYNPAREMQVEDRVHRIGQEREVSVHYCVAEHPRMRTYDLFVEAMQQAKRRVAEEFFRPFEAIDVDDEIRRFYEERLAA